MLNCLFLLIQNRKPALCSFFLPWVKLLMKQSPPPLPKTKSRGLLLPSATKSFCNGPLFTFRFTALAWLTIGIFFLFAQTLAQWFWTFLIYDPSVQLWLGRQAATSMVQSVRLKQSCFDWLKCHFLPPLRLFRTSCVLDHCNFPSCLLSLICQILGLSLLVPWDVNQHSANTYTKRDAGSTWGNTKWSCQEHTKCHGEDSRRLTEQLWTLSIACSARILLGCLNSHVLVIFTWPSSLHLAS